MSYSMHGLGDVEPDCYRECVYQKGGRHEACVCKCHIEGTTARPAICDSAAAAMDPYVPADNSKRNLILAGVGVAAVAGIAVLIFRKKR